MTNGSVTARQVWPIWLVLLALLLAARPAAAVKPSESAAPAASAAPEAEEPSPWRAGPDHVTLGHALTLDVPAGYRFLPKEFAAKALEKNGHFDNDDLLGIAASGDPNEDWFLVMSYDEEGYVKDDEKIDAEELLSALREGTDKMNEERKKRGFDPLTLDGWSEPPHYDQAKHELVWALIVSGRDGKSVNYNTRLLGRRGYTSLNLVTDPPKLAQYKPAAAALLAATHFDQGARYQDFDAKTDKVAEYGLAGLIMAGAGLGAVKLVKLGLLAKFSKVILAALIAGKKAIAAAVLALGAWLRRVFGAKKKDEIPG